MKNNKKFRSTTAATLSRPCYRQQVVENKKKQASKRACRGGKIYE